MKRFTILFALGLLITFGANAQKSDLKGPEYKNRKPWKNPIEKAEVYTKSGESIKGPEAKNATPLERKTGDKVLVTLGGDDKNLMGPAYKNRKPWESTDSAKMYAKDKKDKKKDDGGGTTGSK
jgi:hypothetical protein